MELTHGKRWATFGTGFVGALIAGILFLIGMHVYADHQALHQVIGFINQNAGKIVALPAK